ncbi:MAG: UDP-N-acetylglucosamine 2-epimerase, partial [Opitutaceae bacterium]
IRAETDWSLGILAFGTHLSDKFGRTVNEIEKDGFAIEHAVETMPTDDSPGGIARSMAATLAAFAPIWEVESYDLVLALGDRFEMFAAVASALPFNLKVAHIAGGETTIGAIDNAFRHCITHMACLHFTTTEAYRRRVIELIGHDRGVFNTGSLSVDTLSRAPWIGRGDFKARWGIDLAEPYILITVHPETVSFERNRDYIREVVTALTMIAGYRFVVTMPNADTMGGMIREQWHSFAKENPSVCLIENFGTTGYLTAMRHSTLMLGNTSSGFAEAEFFPKPVVNLGERQRGRIVTPNIINCPFISGEIVAAVQTASAMRGLSRSDVYGDGNAAEKMIGHMAGFLNIKP